MARVVVTDAASRDLRELIRSHNLPEDAIERVRRSLLPLESFPEMGPALGGSFTQRRFLLGPWRWMVAIYRHDPEQDLVVILAFVDARTSTSPTANR